MACEQLVDMPPFPLPNRNLRYPVVSFTTNMGRGPICSSGQDECRYQFSGVLIRRLASASLWKQAITPQQSSSFAFYFLQIIQSGHLRSISSRTSFILSSHNGMVCSPWHQGLRLGGRALVSRCFTLFKSTQDVRLPVTDHPLSTDQKMPIYSISCSL
jgi:hypothetical protein